MACSHISPAVDSGNSPGLIAPGKKLGVVGEPDSYASIALSPDGKHALGSMNDADGRQSDVWLIDLERGNKSR